MDSAAKTNVVIIHDAGENTWLEYSNPARVLQAMDKDSVIRVLEEVDRLVSNEGMHAAGFVAYEAAGAFDEALATRDPGAFPLAWFGIYGEPRTLGTPPASCDTARAITWEPSIHREDYTRSIFRIKEHLHQGDTYQVNYTFRLRSPFSGDPWALLSRMLHAQKGRYGAFISTEDWIVCSASPELFFTLDGRDLVSRPMKGTMKRGLWQEDDLHEATRLGHCEKNRAENLMIVDMVRNDLGRISEPGSVTVPAIFDVEKYPAMWQLTSTICSRTDASLTQIFRALFPPASITGAPKVRTMKIISELEDSPRRIYTGSIGFLSPGRKAQFNVAIRTVLVDRKNHTAEFGTGGGIVWDSVESCEFDECRIKARILTGGTPDFSLLETMLWEPGGGYFLLEKHLERLMESAEYFDRDLDVDAIRDKLGFLAIHMVGKPHRVRLIVPSSGDTVIETKILQHPSRKPYRLGLAQTPVHSADPLLYHKTTLRGIYETAASESPGHDDVLLFNEAAEITESCIANVVVEMGGMLLTPPVRCGLLPGTYRAMLLETGKIREEIIRLTDLSRCSKIYLINSVRGMWKASLELGDRMEEMVSGSG